MKNINQNTSSEQSLDIEEIEKVILCAKWIMFQFEELSCFSVAGIFQKAIDDAEAWVLNASNNKSFANNHNARPFSSEAEAIRKLLVSYASINDPSARNDILRKMEIISDVSDKKKVH